MMGEFKQEFRDGFIEACLHLVNRDYDALAKDFVTLGLLPPTADKDAVTKALTGVFQDVVQGLLGCMCAFSIWFLEHLVLSVCIFYLVLRALSTVEHKLATIDRLLGPVLNLEDIIPIPEGISAEAAKQMTEEQGKGPLIEEQPAIARGNMEDIISISEGIPAEVAKQTRAEINLK